MFGNKPFEEIDTNDLQALVQSKKSEDRFIEYKRELTINSGDDKKEFLADISSFANASGGYLILGIKAIDGIPDEVSGFVSQKSPDALDLDIQNLIRDGIEPRIYGLRVRTLQFQASNIVVTIIYIPQSWSLPHWVSYQGHSKFYSRNSNGKYKLDIGELRQLFTLSETAGQRLKNFRAERLAMIVAGETPVLLRDGIKLVLHIVPFTASNSTINFDVASLDNRHNTLLPLIHRDYGDMNRHNYDGFLTCKLGNNTTKGTPEYTQFFRNGSIEAVNLDMLTDERMMISGRYYEEHLRKALPKFLNIQKRLGVVPPLFVMLSLVGVKGYKMQHPLINPMFIDSPEEQGYHPIEKDALLLPEVVVQSFEFSVDDVLKPLFDMVWNSASWSKSLNYSENGEWIVKMNY